MRRILLFIAFLSAAFISTAQTSGTTTASDRIVAKKRLYIKDYWVNEFQRDSDLSSDLKIPTSKAVHDFVAGRVNGLTIIRTVLTDSSWSECLNGVCDTIIIHHVPGTAYSASNGLTMTSNDIKLGGTLSAATTIAQGGNNLNTTGGKVGIGTTSPDSSLTVEQGLRVKRGIRASGLPVSEGQQYNVRADANGDFTLSDTTKIPRFEEGLLTSLTASSEINCSSTAMVYMNYYRIGFQVTGWGRITTTVTSANTFTQFKIGSLPYDALLEGSSPYGNGTGAVLFGSALNIYPALCRFMIDATKVRVSFVPAETGACEIFIHFSYTLN